MFVDFLIRSCSVSALPNIFSKKQEQDDSISSTSLSWFNTEVIKSELSCEDTAALPEREHESQLLVISGKMRSPLMITNRTNKKHTLTVMYDVSMALFVRNNCRE